MDSIFLDLVIILILILMNGFFAGSEIAVISLRKGRLKALIESGDRRARIVDDLQKDADNFFATVQIGVTLVGTMASAFGGARLVPHVAPLIQKIPVDVISHLSDEIALVLLVLAISYLSLVLGELVPKSLALNNADRFALFVAYPLKVFGSVFSGFTRLLTFSSNLILKFFKDRTSFSESRLVTEEIRHLLEEGVEAGSIQKDEHEMIENVLEMNETMAREVMVPRVDMKGISVDVTRDELLNMRFDYSRIPVYQESLDHVIGLIHVKDLIRSLAHNEFTSISHLVRPAYYVPDSMKIGPILKEMQHRKIHMAIVVDEFGGTAGLLTMEDILEEIVGEIQDETENEEDVDFYRLGDGSFMVSGSVSISDFNERLEVSIPESESYTSLAGYVIHRLGRFPEVGEVIRDERVSIELRKRVRQKMVQFRVRVEEKEEEEGENAAQSAGNGKSI